MAKTNNRYNVCCRCWLNRSTSGWPRLSCWPEQPECDCAKRSADLPRLLREAEHLGRINIQDGTKGGPSGASAPRWVVANEEVKAALQLARHASPPRSRNLLAVHESYAAFLHQTMLPARETLHENGLKGFHELRAAYACERYRQLTRHSAPVTGGHCYRIDPNLDRQARLQISLELGHNRINVFSAFIGGRV